MIDKLDTRVPAATPYTRSFSELYAELRNDPKGPFRSAQHYLAVADLRPYGFDTILHTHCKHGKGDHKVELIDAGIRSLDFLSHEVRRIFEVNPAGLELMRIDLATDVPMIPVTWFLAHARAKFKRFHNAVAGDLEYQQLGKRGIQTVYIGKRPNCFRFYDKIAELLHQYQRITWSAGETGIPTFESLFGFSEDSILTRVERQIGGGRVPEQIATFGSLRRNASEFNPFSNLELTQAASEPQPGDFHEVMQYLAVMQARELVQLWGKHAFYQWLNVHSNRNAPRWWKKYGRWVGDHEGITPTELYERYRDSVSKQLAA